MISVGTDGVESGFGALWIVTMISKGRPPRKRWSEKWGRMNQRENLSKPVARREIRVKEL